MVNIFLQIIKHDTRIIVKGLYLEFPFQLHLDFKLIAAYVSGLSLPLRRRRELKTAG